MSSATQNELKLTITQDKLVDILMHAATREDIAKLDAKLEANVAKLDAKIDSLEDRTNARFDKVDVRFDKVDARFDKLESHWDKIMWGIIIAILVPIIIQILPSFLK